MTYVIGILTGLIFGSIIGQLKNSLIWQRYMKQIAEGAVTEENFSGIYLRSGISLVVNIATLGIAFLLYDIVPFSGVAFLIGTAVALTIMNKVLAMRQKQLNDGKGGR